MANGFNFSGGERGLYDILRQQFLPEIARLRGQRGRIEEAFFGQALEPGALFGAAKTAAEGTAKELFAPGGEVAQLFRQARGQKIQQGFAPEAAEGAEQGILSAASSRIGDVFAQQAGALEQQRFNALGSLFGQREQRLFDSLTSLFTGAGSAEQLKLARQESVGGVRGTLRKIPLVGGIF